MKRRKRGNKGFTLIELLVVIIIVGILAAIAVPRYFKNIEKSRMAEAYTHLGTMAKSQIRYQLEFGAYTSVLDDLDCDNPNNLPASARYFDYTVPAAAAGTFTVRATRNGNKRATSVSAYLIDLNQDSAWSASWP